MTDTKIQDLADFVASASGYIDTEDCLEIAREAVAIIEPQVKKELLGRLGEALVDRLSDEQMIHAIYAAVEGKE